MKEKREDRRVERTRRMLNEALLALILEKGYEAVTVQNILDRANLGRSTFYAHYRDKEELLLSGFEHLRRDMEKQHQSFAAGKTRGPGAGFNLSLELFRHARDYHRIYKAMVGKQSGQMIMKQAHKYLARLVQDHLSATVKAKKNPMVPLDITVHWLVSSFFALLTWWLDHNMTYTAEQMDELFRKLTLPGIEAALGFKL